MRRGQRRLNEGEERGGGGEGGSGDGGRPINTRSCSTVVIRRLPTLSSYFLLLLSSSSPSISLFFSRRFFFQLYCSLSLSLFSLPLSAHLDARLLVYNIFDVRPFIGRFVAAVWPS